MSLAGGVVILLCGGTGEALADAQVRLLHAVPGGPEAQLRVGAAPRVELEGAGFGEATQYTRVPAGDIQLAFVAGEKRLAGERASLKDGGRYTVVAEPRGGSKGPDLLVSRDADGAAAGKAGLRVVNAAPEVARAEMALDGRRLAELTQGKASRYTEHDPGTYRLAAVKPGSDQELVTRPNVSLVAGTAATAYLIGSGGERARFVVLEDRASAPAVAPATGLGGLTGGGTPWLAALLAAVAAGAAGGLAYSRAL